MEVGVTESAVLDIDVDVKVGGSNPSDRKLLEVSLLRGLSECRCLVRSHFQFEFEPQVLKQTAKLI